MRLHCSVETVILHLQDLLPNRPLDRKAKFAILRANLQHLLSGVAYLCDHLRRPAAMPRSNNIVRDLRTLCWPARLDCPDLCLHPNAPARQSQEQPGLCVNIDASVADHGNKSRKTIDPIRVHAVAGCLREEPRTALRPPRRKAQLSQHTFQGRLNFIK